MDAMSASLQERLLAKAKLSEKARYLPTARIEKRMPAGSDAIATVPLLHEFCAEGGEVDMDAYVASVRGVATVFRHFHCQAGTLAEHHKYAVWFSKWMELIGATTFVKVNLERGGETWRVWLPGAGEDGVGFDKVTVA